MWMRTLLWLRMFLEALATMFASTPIIVQNSKSKLVTWLPESDSQVTQLGFGVDYMLGPSLLQSAVATICIDTVRQTTALYSKTNMCVYPPLAIRSHFGSSRSTWKWNIQKQKPNHYFQFLIHPSWNWNVQKQEPNHYFQFLIHPSWNWNVPKQDWNHYFQLPTQTFNFQFTQKLENILADSIDRTVLFNSNPTFNPVWTSKF